MDFHALACFLQAWFLQALTQKCADDQATLSRALCTNEHAESRVVLPA